MKKQSQIRSLLTIALLLLTGIEAMGQKTTPTSPDPRIPPILRPSTGPPPAVRTSPPVVGTPVGETRVNSISVRIITSTDTWGGTDDPVYFDIGPVGWALNRIHSDAFDRGDDYTFDLPLPERETLFTSDILWMKLRKAGNDDWKPHLIVLVVNGTQYAYSTIDTWLTTNNWYWVRWVNPSSYSPEETFIRSLPIDDAWVPDIRLPEYIPVDWERGLSTVCVTGSVHNGSGPASSPNYSDKDPVGIELQLETVQVNGQNFILDRYHGINHTRYIEIYYRRNYYRLMPYGRRYRVCGNLEWNNWEGFTGDYALIPGSPSDIRELP